MQNINTNLTANNTTNGVAEHSVLHESKRVQTF